MHPPSRRGFTLIELLVAIGVIALLAAMLVPTFGYARRFGRRTKCVSNLREFGGALALYMDDHRGYIPRRGQGVRPLRAIDRDSDWFNCLLPYLGLLPYRELIAQGKRPSDGDDSLLICPEARDPGATYFLPYAMNMYLSPWIRRIPHNIDHLPSPSTLVFMADSPGPYSATVPSSEPYCLSARHGGCANILFLDSHVHTYEGNYLGCGTGDPGRRDVRWQTESHGVNQDPIE